MYTIKIQVENPYYEANVGKLSYEPSVRVLSIMMEEYAEHCLSPVSSISVYKGRKLIKVVGW